MNTSTPPNLHLACPQASPKPKSKLKGTKEMLANVLSCSMECTKSNPILPCAYMGLHFSRDVTQMVIYPQVLKTNSRTRGG